MMGCLLLESFVMDVVIQGRTLAIKPVYVAVEVSFATLAVKPLCVCLNVSFE